MELLETERNYIRVLRSIVEAYGGAFSAEGAPFTEDDRSVLLANTADLLEIHTAFLALIEVQLASTTGRMVSDVFVGSVEWVATRNPAASPASLGFLLFAFRSG